MSAPKHSPNACSALSTNGHGDASSAASESSGRGSMQHSTGSTPGKPLSPIKSRAPQISQDAVLLTSSQRNVSRDS
eukprot:2554093-Pleurochrysis_carterae.AAC.1